MRTKSRLWKSLVAVGALVILAGSGVRTFSQDKSFILVGDTHFDKLTLHDMPWLQANYPNDVSQVNNYSQITQNNFSAFIAELFHQSQIVTPSVAGIIQTGDLQEGLAGNVMLATQMARDARDSLRASSFVPPWILAKGNHEVTGPGGAEAFNSVILPFVSSELNQSVTGTSYSYRIGDVQIIVIDSYDRGNIIPFLKSQLTGSTAKFKLIATHMPVIPVTARLWHIFQDDPVNRDSLLNLIAKYKAIVLCGHLHKYSFVKRSTPYGPIVQMMVSSVISNRDKHTPDYYVTSYGPNLVSLESGYDTGAYLTVEGQYVTDFRMAEMQGYAVLSLNSATGGRSLKVYAGLGEYLYETVDLSTYTLHVDTSGMGRAVLTPNDSIFLARTKVAVNAVPALGWKFDGWSGDLTGTTNPDTVLMDANKSIAATFRQIPAGQFEVRRTIAGSGIVVAEPSGPYYSSGTVVTLRARATAGSRFFEWSGDASGTDTVVSITVNGHKNVTATFVKLKTLRLNVRSSQHGSVVLEPPGGMYVEGSQVLLRAQAETGWEFYEWTGDVNGVVSPQSVSVEENKEVRAVFRKIAGGVQQFGATHDSYVQGSFSASRNFNADSVLRVREGSSDLNRFRAYVQFDVSGVTGNVLGAVMKMRVRPAGLPDGKGIKAGVYAVSTDSWTETALNWNAAPGAGTLLDSTTVSSAGMEYSWEAVDEDIIVQVNGRKISFREFQSRLNGLPNTLKLSTDGIKETLLCTLIAETILSFEALHEKLDTVERVRLYLDQYSNESVYEQWMDAEVRSRVTVTEGELRSAYARFKERRSVAYWILPDVRQAAALRDEIARGIAPAAKPQVKEIDFTESLESVEHAVYGLNEGAVSAPVLVDGSYYVFQLLKRSPHPEYSKYNFAFWRRSVEKKLRARKEMLLVGGKLDVLMKGKKYSVRRDAYDFLAGQLSSLIFEREKSKLDSPELIQQELGTREIGSNGFFNQALITFSDGGTWNVGEFWKKLSVCPYPLNYKNPEELKKGLLDVARDIILFESIVLDAKKKRYDDSPSVQSQSAMWAGNVLAQALLSEFRKSVSVGEEELIQYYDSTRDRHLEPEQRRIIPIIVKDKITADRLHGQIVGGADILSLAAEYSLNNINPDRQKPGIFITRDSWGEIGRVAFTMETGQLSEIIGEGDSAYAIVKLLEIKPAAPYPFEKIRGNLRALMETRQLQERVEAFLEHAVKKYKIVINRAALKKVDYLGGTLAVRKAHFPLRSAVPGFPLFSPQAKWYMEGVSKN